MAPRRRIPWTMRRKLMAALWLFATLAAVAVLGWFFYQFVIAYNFEGLTPGTEPIQAFLPEGGYIRESYPPYEPNAPLSPTPRPEPRPTPIPVEKYSLLNKRMLLPDAGYEVVHCGLSEMRISAADDDRAFTLRGWGYLAGMDAAQSTIYLVVSTKYGDNHRVYLMTRESGSSGVLHPADTGSNLDQADFVGWIRIEDTYADGEYRLGVMVVNREITDQPVAYARLSSEHNFIINGGQIIGMSRDLQ